MKHFKIKREDLSGAELVKNTRRLKCLKTYTVTIMKSNTKRVVSLLSLSFVSNQKS